MLTVGIIIDNNGFLVKQKARLELKQKASRPSRVK
jgi:hypothetical protein